MKGRLMIEGKFITSVQFSLEQAKILNLIKEIGKRPSYAQIVRDAVDFYIRENYPQFLE